MIIFFLQYCSQWDTAVTHEWESKDSIHVASYSMKIFKFVATSILLSQNFLTAITYYIYYLFIVIVINY